MRDYLIGCIEADEDLVELGYHENEKFINDVIEETRIYYASIAILFISAHLSATVLIASSLASISL